MSGDHGGHENHGAASHGHSNDGHHDHHKPRVIKSVINYHIPEPGHSISEFKAPDWKIYKVGFS